MAIQIVPLGPETWPALEALFDEGGDPKWCSCMYWRLRSSEMSFSTAEQNRERFAALVGREPPAGLVALDGDRRAVGWVSVGPRQDYERLERSRTRPRIDDAPVWSIVCFVVSRRARRTGLSTQLLAAAVEHARERGAPAVEAYPVDTSAGRTSAARLYAGTLSTFLRAGFTVVRAVDSPTATVSSVIVRLDLLAGSGGPRQA